MCFFGMFLIALCENGTLLKYIKHTKHSYEKRIHRVLPKPDGPLACLMPSSAIEAANTDYQWHY